MNSYLVFDVASIKLAINLFQLTDEKEPGVVPYLFTSFSIESTNALLQKLLKSREDFILVVIYIFDEL